MKKNKKIICFLTTFIFLLTYTSFLFSSIKSYAEDNKDYIVASYSYSNSKPKSGSFKSGGSRSYSTKPKSTIIKPDSGGFSTKPNKGTSTPKSNNSIKPDSGSFSNKPKNNTKENSGNKNYNDYGDYGGNKSRPIFSSRGFFGYSNPLYGMMYGFRISSWITKIVIIITLVVVLYIVIDFLKNRRN